MQTTSHAITQSVNKKMLDRLAKVGLTKAGCLKVEKLELQKVF